MADTEHASLIQARAVPLVELQRALQRATEDALAGDPESVLRSLPVGYGGVVRLPRESTADILAVRNAFRNASARLRPENGDRGLLATAAREEGPLVAIYFWYTGDAAEGAPDPAHQTPAPATAAAPSRPSTQPRPSPTPAPIVSPAADESVEQPVLGQEWSLPGAAVTLGVSIKTIRRAIKAGRVQARLVAGPRGPEYRVDIRPLLKGEGGGGTLQASATRVTPASPSGFPAPRTPAPPSSVASINLQATLQRLLDRLDSLETEVGRLRQGR